MRNRGTRNKGNKQKTNKMADLNPNISIITLNINGLKTPLNDSSWQSDHDPSACCLQEIHFKHNYINKLKVKAWWKYAMQTLI